MSLSKKQKFFLDSAINSKKNIFLTGKAGTGKSYVIKKFIEKSNCCVVCAPTGVAANNVGGQTIHSLFSILVFEVLTPKDCRFVKKKNVVCLLKLQKKNTYLILLKKKLN